MLRALIISLLLFLQPSLTAIASPNHNILRIHGSNTVGSALIPELVKAWMNSNKYQIILNRETDKEERKIIGRRGEELLSIEIEAHGSSTSFKSLDKGTAELGMSSRPIKQQEIRKLQELGELDQTGSEFIIAIDGLAVILNENNPVSQMKKSTIRDIFSGKVTDWSELGYEDGKINVYARDNKSGTYDTFKSLVLGKKAPLIASAKRYESNQKLSDDVSRDPQGIGFVGLAYVGRSKAIAVADQDSTALLPTKFNVATEDYVLSRRLYLYLPSIDTHPLAKSLAQFATSRHGQIIADNVGFVSQEVVSYDVSGKNNAPKEYLELTKEAKRLSLNIRFRQGWSFLDNKAAYDIERILEYMNKPENSNQQLMLFGFSDSNEVLPYMSMSLSIDRADVVADRLLRKHLAPIRVRGFGQALPVSANNTDTGRIRNRRVEVWIKEKT